ncbi:MAG: glycosyltransferase [Acidithiobacillus sp.]
MHIVIDLQGAQASNRHRGIGRYSMALALALARLAKPLHRISLALNGTFTDTIDPIRSAFTGLVAQEDIHVWLPLTPAHAPDPANLWRRMASEAYYEAFLRHLRSEMVLITSLFEGVGEDVIVSVHQSGATIPTAVVLYDLIPLIHKDLYLADPAAAMWYYNRLAHLQQADILLAILAASRQEAIDYLGMHPARVINISSAMDASFKPLRYPIGEARTLRAKYGLRHPFVMYTGGIDHRKNIERLITAFASLPKRLRQDHHLAVVCSMREPDRARLFAWAAQQGLGVGELVLTGFVSDSDLLALYNLCTLFVFPSWHEGFGLPVLEAMACGAPAIASDRSSLPEVVGWDEALFDPFDARSIARGIERGLTDAVFRSALRTHGLRQAAKFSWEATAARALAAMTAFHARRLAEPARPPVHLPPSRRPSLAYVSPLPPAQSGIADYSAALLPVLAAHYVIDVIVDQAEPVSDPWILGNTRQRSVAWFEQHAHAYDRILYHFGNSHFHRHMFGMLERYPGVVVLHDFFLSGAFVHMEATGYATGAWTQALLRSHGWVAVRERCEIQGDAADVIFKWPCNLAVLERAVGVIVHSDFSRRMADEWYAPGFADAWACIPLLRTPPVARQRAKARTELGLGDEVFLVCTFGIVAQTKLNHRLIEAWLTSRLAGDPRCKLVFVGKSAGDAYGENVQQWVDANPGRISITGWADEASYGRYLAAADLAVQLRTLSRGETSAAVLDCMNYGLPTIVNANGCMADLPKDAVCMLPDDFSTDALRAQLERFQADPVLRQTLGDRAAAHIRTHHMPSTCAERYVQAIEGFYARAEQGPLGLIREMCQLDPPQNLADLSMLAERMAILYPPKRQTYRQILVDISALHRSDAKTGKHRVTRSVLQVLLNESFAGFRAKPIYATAERGYCYARRFTAHFLGLGDLPLDDAPVFAQAGDVFWGLDSQPELIVHHQHALNALRLCGVKMIFTVHDLFPVMLPECTGSGMEGYSRWLQTLASAGDGVLCVSAAVAANLKRWLGLFGPGEGHTLHLGWVRPGVDGVERGAAENLLHHHTLRGIQHAAMLRHPAFLMVGTLDPRKAYAQTLAAFELLWHQGEQVNLIIVGEQGRLVDELVHRLRTHPLRERHLFWVEDADVRVLERLYADATCLIATALDDGYGLSLIEAMRHELPILARDIPVFREVAGAYARYFSGLAPTDIACAVRQWLKSHEPDQSPAFDAMRWVSWEESVKTMLAMILEDQWQDRWEPVKDDTRVVRYWGSDRHLLTIAGRREGTQLVSTGRRGYLMYGPYLDLEAGSYVMKIYGSVGRFGLADAMADICLEGGNTVLVERSLEAPEDGREGVLATLRFTLTQFCRGLEARVLVSDFSDLRIGMVELRKEGHSPRSAAPPKATVQTRQRQQSPIALAHRYWATHPRMESIVGYPVGRSIYATGEEGILIFGPYVGLPKGDYVATVHGVALKPGDLNDCWMDVSWNRGDHLVVRRAIYATTADAVDELGRVAFELQAYAEDIEVRVYVATGIAIRVDEIAIKES